MARRRPHRRRGRSAACEGHHRRAGGRPPGAPGRLGLSAGPRQYRATTLADLATLLADANQSTKWTLIAELDELDLLLVTALQTTPRADWQHLGQVLGTSASTAARRWARLTQAGLAWQGCHPLRRGNTFEWVGDWSGLRAARADTA